MVIEYLKSRFFKSNWNNHDAYQQAMVAAGHFVFAAWTGWLIGLWVYLGFYVAKEAVDVWRTRGRAWADSAVDIVASVSGLTLAGNIGFEAWASISAIMVIIAAHFVLDYLRMAARER